MVNAHRKEFAIWQFFYAPTGDYKNTATIHAIGDQFAPRVVINHDEVLALYEEYLGSINGEGIDIIHWMSERDIELNEVSEVARFSREFSLGDTF